MRAPGGAGEGGKMGGGGGGGGRMRRRERGRAMHYGAARPAVAFLSGERGPLKVAARVSKRLLKGIPPADREASKGRKREMIDGRSQ